MVGMLIDQIVSSRREMLAVHPFKPRAWDSLPHVTDDRVDEPEIAEPVPVHSPRIRAALTDHFKDPPDRMIPPNAAIQTGPLAVWGSGFPHIGCGLDSVAPVKPAVRTPLEAID